MPSRSFDRHQFDNSRGRFHKDTREAELTYEELHQSGHTIRVVGRSKTYIPEFYTNDSQLRAVLAKAVVGYCFRSTRVPDNLATDLVNLQRIALERQSRVEDANRLWNATVEHINAVRASGSYLALIAGISYRAWRLGWHDQDIANELGMTKAGVGRILRRLVRYAEELGFQTYAHRKLRDLNPERVHELWNQGRTVSQIVVELKTCADTVRHILRLKNVFVWNRNCGHDVPLKQGRGQQFCPVCYNDYQREYQRKKRKREADLKFVKTVAWG